MPSVHKWSTNKKTFEEDLEALLAQEWSIENAIPALNSLFLVHFDLDPYQINCGDCEWYADLLNQMMRGQCESMWGDELTNEDDDHEQYAYHHITRYSGRYYDSQHPWGVDDFREISAFNH